MSASISDFSNAEINAVQVLVNTRCGEQTELQLGDSEVQLSPKRAELTECPVVYWNARECNFIVLKTGENQFRAQYFYTPHEQVSTRQAFFTTVEDCVIAVLREQAENAREAGDVTNGAAAAELH